MRNILKKSLLLLLILIIVVEFASCALTLNTLPASILGRGMNIANALEAPNEGDWGVVIEDYFFGVIFQAGFNTVRIPVKWSAHASGNYPYTIEEEFFSRIDHIVNTALFNRLKIVINVHHYDELMENPDGFHSERFLSIWDQIARRYDQIGENLYFELLNEPHGNLTFAKWNVLMNRAIDVIRDISPDRKIIITGANWGSAYSLENVTLPADKTNLIASIHVYTPSLFTKQGAPWMGDSYATTGVQWPGPPEVPIQPVQAAMDDPEIAQWFYEYNTFPYYSNPAGPVPLETELDRAFFWSLRTRVPIWVGEFGSYEKGEMQYRKNWTSFVRAEAEKRGFTWAYWEFAAGFSAFDLASDSWRVEILDSLIP